MLGPVTTKSSGSSSRSEYGGTDRTLDGFGRAFADTDVVLLADVALDVVGKDVAGRIDRLGADDAAQRDAGDLRRTAADVDDHVAFGRLDVEARTQRRGHRFVDHVDFAASGVLGRIAHGTYLDVGRSRRDADHHPAARGRRGCPEVLTFLIMPRSISSVAVEIGDHAVLQRPDRLDVRVGLFVHLARLVADGDHLARMRRRGPRSTVRRQRPCRYRLSACWPFRGRWPAPVSVKKVP